MSGLVGLAMLLSAVCLQPEAADLLLKDDFEGPLSEAWRPYDNWSTPQFGVADDTPLGRGRALRIAFDDKSTLAHFDKGAIVFLPQPLPWPQVDFISARYHVDNKVGNLRIFCHCDKGGWWDYTTRDVEVGKPGKVTALREEFRLAWTDDPARPGPPKDGNILAVFFSVHNDKPVNSGERFVMYLDDVEIGTWLLPVREPVRCDEPPLKCWALGAAKVKPDPLNEQTLTGLVAVPCGSFVVWGGVHGETLYLAGVGDARAPVTVNGQMVEARWRQHKGSWRFQAALPLAAMSSPHGGRLEIRCGDVSWSGRYAVTRQLSPAEALALSFRTGAARWEVLGSAFMVGKPLRLKAFLPLAWADTTLHGHLCHGSGATFPLLEGGRHARASGSEVILTTRSQPPWVATGEYRAVLSLRLLTELVEVTNSVRIEELERSALRAEAPKAAQQAQVLAEKARRGRGEKWWAREALTTTPQVRDRQRVDPRRWTRIKDPVLWEDIGGDFVGGAQCGIDDDSLRLYFEYYDFGRVIKPHLGYFLRDGWRDSLQKVASKNLIVTSVWGYVPDMPWNGGFGHVEIPPEQHQEIVRILGRRFLGYEMGEQDGRYIGSYAPKHQPATRQEAKRLFDEWHQKIIDNFHGRMIALASLNFLHDYARLGHRMLGIEASQGLPSDIMEWAFIRGASKQWGALTWNCISIFNRWGYKSYTDAGADHGPDKGPTVELLRRLWYVTYMYGSAINMFEAAYFTAEKDEAGFPKLSPVGQCHVDAVKWAREHHDRGVLYTPVAIMLDRDSGWVPPRHLYTGNRYLVWGNLPYGLADHATDAFFRTIWPRYEDCSYYADERGYLTATPYGDMFDVILSDAPTECLARYQTVVLLSERGLADEESIQRLALFVKNGGELICDVVAAEQLGAELTGVEIVPERRVAQMSVILPAAKVLEEEPYSYVVVTPRGAQALALSEHGDGILWRYNAGRGMVVTSCVPCYVAAKTDDPQEGVDVPLQHKLLRAFMHTLDHYLKSLSLLEVSGSPVGYLCNVSEDKKRLIVTVVNNEHQPATVAVKPRLGEIAAYRSWLETAEVSGGELHFNLPPLDLAIVEITLKQ